MRTCHFLPFIALLVFCLFTASHTHANHVSANLLKPSIDSLPVKTPASVDTLLFTKVDQEASFPGGISSWSQFLQSNLKADIPVRRKAPAGTYTVVVQFIVDKKGILSDIQPLTALGYGMEAEVVRVLRKSPKWLPAQMNGGPVKAYRKQPITFMVSEGK